MIKRATITVRSSASGNDPLNLSVASMILSGVPLRLLSDAVQQVTAHRLRRIRSPPSLTKLRCQSRLPLHPGLHESVRSLNLHERSTPKPYPWVLTPHPPSFISLRGSSTMRSIPPPSASSRHCGTQSASRSLRLPLSQAVPAKLIGQIEKFRANEVAGCKKRKPAAPTKRHPRARPRWPGFLIACVQVGRSAAHKPKNDMHWP